ncbi:endopolygalacturonase [Kiritimatiellaeota bacterium B1221]|nr:endopolygalacturonase [Kiritimatiellaeota bacterium B1221]
MKDVSTLGISPSDAIPCAAALNALLQQNPGSLFFPAGTYLIDETLRLPSHTHLKLDDGATLKLADGAAQTANDYLLCNADPEKGNEDIILEGGCFDGNQIGNPRPEGLFTDGYTGAMIHFENVRGLKLLNLCMSNAEAYYSRYTHVHDFHIENITFDSQKIRHNNDGIHLGGHCSHGVIRKLRALTPGVTGDDLVALNADDALTRNEVRGMTNGPITDIQIEDLEAVSCHTFVRMLSVFSPIQNVSIRKIRGGCEVGAINADGARNCRVPVFDHENPPNNDGVGLLENIDIRDVKVSKRRAGSTHGLFDLQERMVNFRIQNFERDLANDLSPAAPTIRLKYSILKDGQVDEMILEDIDTLNNEEAFDLFNVSFKQLALRTSAEEPNT